MGRLLTILPELYFTLMAFAVSYNGKGDFNFLILVLACGLLLQTIWKIPWISGVLGVVFLAVSLVFCGVLVSKGLAFASLSVGNVLPFLVGGLLGGIGVWLSGRMIVTFAYS